MSHQMSSAGDGSRIGSRLQAVRIDQCMTQAQFARVLGVSARTYHGFERETADLSFAVLAKLHDLYGISSDWLLFGIGMPTRAQEGQALKEFEAELEQYLAANKKSLPPADRSGLVKRWFDEMGLGRRTRMEAVRIWIDILEERPSQ